MSETTVFDIVRYILKKHGTMSAMKLQKLVYYSQAWSLVWQDEPLFENKIEAWANGPVIRDLYDKHRGKYQVSESDFARFASGHLSKQQKETITAVLDAYGNKSAQWLSDQTHSEPPWQNAREGLSDADRGAQEITLAAMAEYYETL